MPDASTKTWDAASYDSIFAFVWRLGASLIELLQPQAGERILDLGCGTGQLTAQIAQSGAAVLGIDNSPAMIAQARANHPKLRFDLGDARTFHFDAPFAAVFSNAALHWIKEPEAVIGCVARALQPGGRFVAEFGGKDNVRSVAAALEHALEKLACGPFVLPWYFPSVAEYAALLEKAGIDVTFATLFDRPTRLEGPDAMRQWIWMFAASVLDQVPAEKQDAFFHSVEEKLRPALI